MMTAPWRDKEPFRWIAETFRKISERDGVIDRGEAREMYTALSAALHEMDDLNARIAELKAALRELVDLTDTLCEAKNWSHISELEQCPLCLGEDFHYSDCLFIVGKDALTRAEALLTEGE